MTQATAAKVKADFERRYPAVKVNSCSASTPGSCDVKTFPSPSRTCCIRVGRADLIIAGEIPLSLTCCNFKVDQDRKAGAPIDWVSIGPLIARPNGAGVLRNTPHPHAARTTTTNPETHHAGAEQ